MSITKFAIVVLGVALLATTSWAAGPDPGINVTVTNPLSMPVPVAGSVSVSGIIDARQSGPWNVGASQNGTWFVDATQIGSWNIGILGTPTVGLAAGTTVKIDFGSNPLLVKNVNDASEVFQTSVQVTIPDNFCCGEVGSFTVPSGKRLSSKTSPPAHISSTSKGSLS